MAPATREKRVHPPTASIEAYNAFLKGRYHWNRYTGEGYQKGIESFEQACTIDPNYAQAQAWLANAYAYQAIYGTAAPHDVMPNAKVAARKAYALDETLAEAHYALGLVHQYYEWDWESTEREYRRAMELNPGDATAQAWWGIFLSRWSRRKEEARAQAEAALRADPVSLDVNVVAGWVPYFTGSFERAATKFAAAAELYPSLSTLHAYEGMSLTGLGRLDDAITAYRKAEEMGCADPIARGSFGDCLARAGHREEAEALGVQLEELRAQSFFPACPLSMVYAGLGQTERTFEWLEEAFRDRDPILTFVGVFAPFRELRSDPRFTDLIQRVGVE